MPGPAVRENEHRGNIRYPEGGSVAKTKDASACDAPRLTSDACPQSWRLPAPDRLVPFPRWFPCTRAGRAECSALCSPFGHPRSSCSHQRQLEKVQPSRHSACPGLSRSCTPSCSHTHTQHRQLHPRPAQAVQPRSSISETNPSARMMNRIASVTAKDVCIRKTRCDRDELTASRPCPTSEIVSFRFSMTTLTPQENRCVRRTSRRCVLSASAFSADYAAREVA